MSGRICCRIDINVLYVYYYGQLCFSWCIYNYLVSLYAYFLYVIGTSVLVIVCVGVIFVALVFYSKK